MTDLRRMPCGQGTGLMVEVGWGSGIDGWFGGRGERPTSSSPPDEGRKIELNEL